MQQDRKKGERQPEISCQRGKLAWRPYPIWLQVAEGQATMEHSIGGSGNYPEGYDLYVKNRMGIEAIAAVLNKDGIRTRDGADWRFSAVLNILTHPAYKGKHKVGIPMPVIVGEDLWEHAQRRREEARTILADPKGWLLQGMVFWGMGGHVLKCLRKRPKEPAYYACHGRVNHDSRDGGKRRALPYIRADWLVMYGIRLKKY